jgi:putative serine protease PepD
MTSDPSPGRRPGLGRLWTDPRETEEHTPWLEPKRAAGPRPVPLRPAYEPPGAPGGGDEPRGDEPDRDDRRAVRRRRVVLGILLGTIVAALLVGAGVLGASLLGGHDDAPSAALPVVPGAAPADQHTRSIRAIYAAAKESIVPVRAISSGSEGTGFVIDSGGVIVTNAHVVKDSDRVEVRLKDKGSYVDAKVLGIDEGSDLAVLQADGAAALRPLALGNSDDVQVGDQTLAIGYPLDLNRSSSASSGIVSGVGRSLRSGQKFAIENVIQTDAAINHGNSGGPLLDSAGRVIGVNTAILTSPGGGSIGIGFAVPSNTVREVVPRLEHGRTVPRAYLGIQTQESPTQAGAQVAVVTPGTPAAGGGLEVGDLITGIDGQPVVAPDDVSAAVASRRPGAQVAIDVQRAGARKTLHVTLGTRPASAATSQTSATP